MPRVKRGRTRIKKRKSVLARTKGFKWGRKSKIKLAKTAATKAGAYAYRDRRNKKRDFRALWQVQINAACRLNDTIYSQFINALKKADIQIDRKILSTLAKDHPEIFSEVVKAVK